MVCRNCDFPNEPGHKLKENQSFKSDFKMLGQPILPISVTSRKYANDHSCFTSRYIYKHINIYMYTSIHPYIHYITLHYITLHYITLHYIPYHTIPYHTIPYHTIPYHTIPYIRMHACMHSYIYMYVCICECICSL